MAAWISSAREIYSIRGCDTAPFPDTLFPCHLHCPWTDGHQWREAWFQPGQAQNHLSIWLTNELWEVISFQDRKFIFPYIALYLCMCFSLPPLLSTLLQWSTSLHLLISCSPEHLQMLFPEQYLLWTINKRVTICLSDSNTFLAQQEPVRRAVLLEGAVEAELPSVGERAWSWSDPYAGCAFPITPG